jgi:ornithine cyclodeaminase/alanine dehydrogenase
VNVPGAPLYLTRERIEELAISPSEVIGSIEAVLRARARSRAWNAPKAVIQPPDGRYMMATLSASDDPPFLAVKALLLNPRNRSRGLSDINALVTCSTATRASPWPWWTATG